MMWLKHVFVVLFSTLLGVFMWRTIVWAVLPQDPTNGHALVVKEFPNVCWDTSIAQPGLPGAKIFEGPYCDYLKAQIGKKVDEKGNELDSTL